MIVTTCATCAEPFTAGDLDNRMGVIGHIVVCPVCKNPNKAAGFTPAPITNLNEPTPPTPPPVRFLFGDGTEPPTPPPKRIA